MNDEGRVRGSNYNYYTTLPNYKGDHISDKQESAIDTTQCNSLNHLY